MQEIKQQKSQIKQNILLYLRQKGVSEYRFYRDSGITRGILQQPNGISEENLSRFLDYATDINYHWLFSGEGDMFKTKRPSSEFPTNQLSESHHKVINNKGIEQDLEVDNSKMRPRIPLEAAAGSLSIVTQSVSQRDCEMLPLIARIPDYDFTIMVKGDSMEPGFLSGDEVACRMIRERSFIQWGQPHVIDSYDGIVLKRIHDKGDKILCTSDNPAYGNFYIPKTDIYNLARVVGLIRQY